LLKIVIELKKSSAVWTYFFFLFCSLIGLLGFVMMSGRQAGRQTDRRGKEQADKPSTEHAHLIRNWAAKHVKLLPVICYYGFLMPSIPSHPIPYPECIHWRTHTSSNPITIHSTSSHVL